MTGAGESAAARGHRGAASEAGHGRRARLAPDERRAQILACARKLFGAKYYGAISMEEVAAAAGVTRGLLNHYFGTKRDLYLAVVREMFREVELPEPVYLQSGTAQERLAESVDRWLEMSWRNRRTLLGALGADGLGRDPELAEILEQVSESAVDRIIETLGICPPASAPDELRAVVRSFGGLAQEATREWLQRGRLNREQLQELFTRSLLWLVNDVVPGLQQVAAKEPARRPAKGK
jgi:AcrR family transcriptional regulator